MIATERFGITKFVRFMTLFVIALMISPVSHAQAKDTTGNNLKKNAIKALIDGINSSNRGVAQSAIYMAGYYKYWWTVSPLVNVLDNPAKEVDLRILAAYSLFMIGDDKGMQAIKAESISDDNYMVRGTCNFIYKDYLIRKADELYIFRE